MGGGCSCTQAHRSGVTCLTTCWRIQDFHTMIWSGVFWSNLRKRTGELLVGLSYSHFSQFTHSKHADTVLKSLVSKESEIYRNALRKLGKNDLQKRQVLMLSFTGKGVHLSASNERKLMEYLCHLDSTKLDMAWEAGFSPLP